MGTEFDLEVALVHTDQEEFDDLEVPESIDGTRSSIGRWIPVVGCIDGQEQRRARMIDAQPDASELVRFERLSIPGPLDLELDPAQLYTPPMLDQASREPNESTSTWADGSDPKVLPQVVRRAFPALEGPIEVRLLSGGLLHQSFHVRARNVEYVLQRVSDVFAPEIHDNIQAVTKHLTAHAIACAPLIPNVDGELSIELGEEGRWRLMPHLGGASFETLQSIEQARSAGLLVGRFHTALKDFDAPLAPLGIPYRETAVYLDALDRAFVDHADHRLAPEMQALRQRVLDRFAVLGPAPDVPERVIHGDLKLSNLLFEDSEPPGRDIAFALIDLDTLMRAPLWVELGDAWRSWCHCSIQESSPEPSERKHRELAEVAFAMDSFEASLDGFLEGLGEPLAEAERDSLVLAPERITLELCARFITDALEESYFAWDESSFRSRGDHNAARAATQWRLCDAMQETRAEREAILRRLA